MNVQCGLVNITAGPSFFVFPYIFHCKLLIFLGSKKSKRYVALNVCCIDVNERPILDAWVSSDSTLGIGKHEKSSILLWNRLSSYLRGPRLPSLTYPLLLSSSICRTKIILLGLIWPQVVELGAGISGWNSIACVIKKVRMDDHNSPFWRKIHNIC